MPSVPSILVVAELPTIGGDPLDWSHNTFAFQVDAVGPTAVADCFSTVKDFYNHTAGTAAVSSIIAASISRVSNACVLRAYDISAHLDGTPHGSPIGIDTFTLGAAFSTTSLPEGVAIGLSFHSAYGTDVEFGGSPPGTTRPRARDRGRIYLGPIDASSPLGSDGTTHRTFVSATARNLIAASAAYMVSTPHGLAVWSCWSRASAKLSPVIGGWVDDRFDYQRRREDQGLVRTTW